MNNKQASKPDKPSECEHDVTRYIQWKRYEAEIADTDKLFNRLVEPLNLTSNELPDLWKFCREIIRLIYSSPLT